ncbi:hypothetical protein [Thermosediminibacter oceani]|uniref:Helix-turn-helix type 11 domain-containing protein n=1 Tax=Thermosediminibacter oceani (strain ATCC BAA-1034 / DSM 16646 / JW/IW-1228P) TaxID=555079 RepID=D9RXP2_THEOJ|nr:hypothetical protein [Thermosediminibacter oceani]ADL08116.1 conserved hypothetical protein [Thermosediminibacter oceani DSM 16646]
MKKKSKAPRMLLRPEESLTDYLELFDEDVHDEDIARAMNVDIETVRSIRGELDDENTSPKRIFFKKTRGKN